MKSNYDAVVVGGGLLGSAIGYGLVRKGLRVIILDEGDDAYRAARGNFGLVWVQSKGIGRPVYADWTKRSSELWPAFADELQDRTGVDVQLSQAGGINVCLSEQEFEDRTRALEELAGHQGERFQYEMLGRNALAEYLPGLGPDVVGGSFCPHDGHVNPLYLLRAMQEAFVHRGGKIVTGMRVAKISKSGAGFSVAGEDRTVRASKVVLAAGLGNLHLAPQVGLAQPVKPVKGQVLVTERIGPFLERPTTQIRQTGEGTVMIGDSHEDVGFDLNSTPRVLKVIADRARRTFPALAELNIVRCWGALRVMTPDGIPIYDQSETMPGAFAVSCHSGVTLAAAHALDFSGYVVDGALGDEVAGLSSRRFDVQAA